ncbi:hypothetical protein [Methylobacterium soli]|uniref:hypothetical protein n=1 Tax=Methylobacterium soli TaxID=553447 RepID=UPI001EE38CD0|nr:hypothetical protein [Methylobacterium soli]GJE43157.1 hypothetical protein AEGHOMDF_2336 [Methylobacterium soli]
MSTGEMAAVTLLVRSIRGLGGLAALGLALSAIPFPTRAADLGGPVPGRFAAVCEDLGRLCFAQGCGRDQIDAALGCQALCPSAVVLRVEPASCLIPHPRAVLHGRR